MLVVVAAAAGALVGPLLAVPAYRLSVPEGYRPGCAACAHRLTWFGAGRPGRCPGCRARIGPRPWTLSVAAALTCAGLAWALGPRPELALLLPLGLLGVLLAAIDLAAERLPDVLVLPGLAGTVFGFAVLAAVTGHWGSWGRALLAGLAYLAGLFVLAMLPGGQLGLGDIKLAALLGVCLGWFGWPILLAGVLLPWLVNAPVALVLLLRRRGGSMPFGPAMLTGAFVAVGLLVPVLAGQPH